MVFLTLQWEKIETSKTMAARITEEVCLSQNENDGGLFCTGNSRVFFCVIKRKRSLALWHRKAESGGSC